MSKNRQSANPPNRQSASQNEAEIRISSVWPSVVPCDDQSDYPSVAQIFAYGAQTPSEDAIVCDEGSKDSDDYVAQS